MKRPVRELSYQRHIPCMGKDPSSILNTTLLLPVQLINITGMIFVSLSIAWESVVTKIKFGLFVSL